MQTFGGRPPRNPPQYPGKAWESAEPLSGAVVDKGRRPMRPTTGVAPVMRGLFIAFAFVWAALFIGLVFLTPGTPPSAAVMHLLVSVMLVRQALTSTFRARRLRAAGKDAANHPWLFDRRWDSAGARDSSWRAYAGVVVPVFGCAAVWAYARGLSSGQYEGLQIPLFIGCAGWLGYTLYDAHRRAGLGDTFVCWDDFPFFVGGPVDLTFGVAASGGVFEKVRFVLRCVHEIDIRTCVLHEQTYELQPNQTLPAPDTFTEVHFDVAPDAWGTILDPQVTVSWELLVEGETSQGPYKWWFPLPVYRRTEGEQ